MRVTFVHQGTISIAVPDQEAAIHLRPYFSAGRISIEAWQRLPDDAFAMEPRAVPALAAFLADEGFEVRC